jgi:hypothetical protein
MGISWVIVVGGLGTLMPWVFVGLLKEVPVVFMAWICVALTAFAWWGYASQADIYMRAVQPIACVAATLVSLMVVGCICFDRISMLKGKNSSEDISN